MWNNSFAKYQSKGYVLIHMIYYPMDLSLIHFSISIYSHAKEGRYLTSNLGYHIL